MAALPRTGDQFGRYHIDSQIGRGGMGVVFGATDTSFDRRVALKVVSSSLGDNEDFLRRFEHEASLLARLDSPHVIAIFDYGVEAECPYIATQYVAGGDLGGLIQARGAMPPSLAALVCAQVADALHDAHRVGVVHRDVKPANVLLRDADTLDLHAYLCDFGIARTETDGLTAPGSVSGTWSYLSPECGRGAPGTPASDIYALGCLFWASITGSAPYRGTDIEIAVGHQQLPVRQLVGDSEQVHRMNAILARTMAKEPGDRYPDADELRRDLLAVNQLPDSPVEPVFVAPIALSGGSGGSGAGLSRPSTPSGATPSGPMVGSAGPTFSRSSTDSPPRKRRTGLIVGGAVAAVLLVAGGIVAVTQIGGGEDDPTPDPGGTSAADGGVERLDDGGPIRGDLDGDGLGDVGVDLSRSTAVDGEVANQGESLDLLSDGTALSESEPAAMLLDGPYRRIAGYFDDDDQLDALMLQTDRDTGGSTLTGTLSGGAEVSSTLPPAPPETDDLADVMVADVDGDGLDDLVIWQYDEDVKASRFVNAINTGDAVFAEPTLALEVFYLPSNNNPQVGDYNGDGMADIALSLRRDVANFATRARVDLHLGDGTSYTLDAARSFPASFDPHLATGDVDGDEVDDLVVVRQGQGSLSFDELNYAGPDRLQMPRRLGLLPLRGGDTISNRVVFSDVNGDGLDDAVGLGPDGAGAAAISVALSDGEQLGSPQTWFTLEEDVLDLDNLAFRLLGENLT